MSPECQASTSPKGDKKNRPAVAVWPGGDIKRDRHARHLRFSLALLQEALLRGARERFAVFIDGLWFAGLALALRQKTCLGRTCLRYQALTWNLSLGHPGSSELAAAAVVAVQDVAASARC